ncbi:hypothetical protein UR09_00460 [Candidatus Nitromaritima sp. SCGC AAA799-A02]|nr:hypothetical protein UR09_00460 [Candidatus Nitromaritima sp. SCGC AAA799-A02]
MNTLKEKVVGSWYGMAVGDAMGLAVRGLKPETVRQLFGAMDGFKDVRPFLGKGIKRFSMQGLYGIQTQSALVIADCLLKNKSGRVKKDILELWVRLSAGGPEHYLGVYRRPESGFSKAIGSLMESSSARVAEHDRSDASFSAMGIPVGLIYRDRTEEAIGLSVEIGLLMSRNLCEVTGVALAGYLAGRLLLLDPGEGDSPLTENDAERVLFDAEELCRKAEARFGEAASELWEQTADPERGMLEYTLRGLRENWSLGFDDLVSWICQNASGLLKTKITNPAQGHVLTLIPLALVLALREGIGFDSALTRGLSMGKEADKTGVLVGAWAGALYGWSRIPQTWRSGLVNGKEIRLRGESLFSGRLPRNVKDLYEMELGLTAKEYEMGKKFFPRPASKFTRPTPRPALSWEDDTGDETALPEKSDVAGWRKFQKDKSKMKRDRRKHLKQGNDDYE